MLTPAQQQALRTDLHLSVTANAGSGKTRVLVERYLRIVTSGDAGVANVVAITFTEKAASELRRKAAEGLQHLLTAAPDADARRRVEAVRDDLPSAVIHTIHGFCARLLREFPVEAGVDAAFGVIEPVDRALLVEDALSTVFRSILREGARPDLAAQLAAAARTFGTAAIRSLVLSMSQRRELLERMLDPGGVLSRSDADLLGLWNGAGREHVLRELDRRADALGAILETCNGRSAPAVRELLARFRAPAAAEERETLARELLGHLLTKSGALTAAVGGRVERDTPSIRRLTRALHPLAELLRLEAPEETHAVLLNAVRALCGVHLLVMERCEEIKRERALLDYDDLQLRARALLRKEPVRRRLASRYRYIMVDEYQDTNRLQYELLQPLVDDLQTGNLFIVGDPKQSIYGFRNAEVEVFRQTRADILQAAGPSSAVTLGESFRPLAAPAAFINMLFSSAMGEGGAAEIAYEEIVQARESGRTGGVELIVAGGGGPGVLIARRIRSLVGEEGGGVRLGDIAVLVRTRNLLPQLEEAFVQEGIPYLVSGGTGYFQTQDVYDFMNYLRFILDPADDLALTGVLRSPFYAVSDPELFEAARDRRGTTLWEHLRAGAGGTGRAPSLVRALTLLEEHRSCGHRLPVPDLLERIVADTGYEASLAGLPGGEQSLANLRKLEDFVRRFDERGFTALYDVVRRLRHLVEEEEREGQGAIDLSRDAVQLMTVHAAKGLEFPVVIVPGLERRFVKDRGLFLEEELGMAFRPPSHLGSPAPLAHVLSLRKRARAEAEEKRVFYVACTRARDMLILAAGGPAPEGESTWLGWLQEAMGWAVLPSRGHVELRVPLRVYRAGESGTTTGVQDVPLDLTVLGEEDLPPTEAPPADRSTLVAQEVRMEDVAPPRRSEVYTATQLRTYADCPARYYLRYVLGIDADARRVPEDGETSAPRGQLPANVRGSLVHALLQRLDGVKPEGLPALAGELLLGAGYRGADAADRAAEIADAAARVRASAFWGEAAAGSGTRTEYAVTAPIGTDFLAGTFDRVYRDAEGVICVLDFKTDAVTAEELGQAAQGYRLQLEVYAYLAARLYGEDRIRGILLFTRHPDRPVRVEFDGPGIRGVEEKLLVLLDRINSFDFNPLEENCRECEWLLPGCPLR